MRVFQRQVSHGGTRAVTPLAILPGPLATRPEALATRPEALATRPEALATRPEALATRPEALATRLGPLGAVVVAVLGREMALDALATALPAGWSVLSYAAPEAALADVVVLFAATPEAVRGLRRVSRGIPIVAVASPGAEAEVILGLLGAGADACVRASDARLVAAHVLACIRRGRYRTG
jgi:hypothetical protein